jgi:hypothetical protein
MLWPSARVSSQLAVGVDRCSFGEAEEDLAPGINSRRCRRRSRSHRSSRSARTRWSRRAPRRTRTADAPARCRSSGTRARPGPGSPSGGAPRTGARSSGRCTRTSPSPPKDSSWRGSGEIGHHRFYPGRATSGVGPPVGCRIPIVRREPGFAMSGSALRVRRPTDHRSLPSRQCRDLSPPGGDDDV